MIDLRERLQELADAATREGVTPGAAAAVRRGRRRRRHLVAGVASVLVVTLAGVAGITDRPPGQGIATPIAPATTSPPSNPEASRNKPSRHVLDQTFGMMATELRRCPGGSSISSDLVGYVWSAKYRQVLMVAAKRPPASETRFCWTIGWSGKPGSTGVMGARRVRANGTPLTFTGNIEPGFAQIAGRVAKQATRVQLRFRDGRAPMDLEIIRATDRYPVNFYAGFFSQGPTSPEQGGWAAANLTALDRAGRTITTCRVGPPGDGMPKCPGN